MPKPRKIKSVADTKHLFWGLFSFPGVGKTRLLGTACDVAEKGVLILRPPTDHQNSMRPQDARRAEVWTMRDHDDLAEAGEFIAIEGSKHYDWISFDSLSLFTDHGLDQMWEDIIAAKPHRAQFGLDQGEYFHNMTRIMRWVRKFVAMDEFNFVWTAHCMDFETNEGMQQVPQVQVKNMWQKATGYCNLVTYLEKVRDSKSGEVKRVLRTEETDEYYAKCQFHGAFANDRLVDPTVAKLMERIDSVRPKTTTTKRRPGSAKARMRARRNS